LIIATGEALPLRARQARGGEESPEPAKGTGSVLDRENRA